MKQCKCRNILSMFLITVILSLGLCHPATDSYDKESYYLKFVKGIQQEISEREISILNRPKPKPKPIQVVSRGEEIHIKEMVVTLSHYGLNDTPQQSKGIAKNGERVVAWKTCAVNPKIIPLNSIIYIPSLNIRLKATDIYSTSINGIRVDIFTGLSKKENEKLGLVKNVVIQIEEVK